MLEVAEIFESIQGEGPLMGRPAVFLRLSGCLRPYCDWCDTPEALEPGKAMSVGEAVDKLLSHTQRQVVITGGEPFIQWDGGLQELSDKLVEAGCKLQYETSGKAEIPADPKGMVVCSPKPAADPQLDTAQIGRVDAFKFVVDTDIAPIVAFCGRHKIAAHKIWLMPLGASRKSQLDRMPAVWALCVKHGFKFSPRLHILAFDTKKGI